MTNKILICDDEEGIRESLKLVLGNHYDLILTDTAEQCLQIIEKDKNIGLLLLDIKLPQISGTDVLKIIKEKHPNLEVIIVSGYKSTDVVSEVTKLGANGYIVKPFKTDEILETVKRHI